MSVELLVQHPGGEWMEVEVGPMESLAGLKERVASQSGMCVNTFDLSFEGEVFGDSDGRLVGELPFGDRSELQLVLNKKEVALHHLKELGWAGKGVMSLADHKSGEDADLSVEGRQDLDRELCEVLAMMMEAGMCNDGQKCDLVNNMSHRGFIQCVDFLLAAGADMLYALKEAVSSQQVAMIQFLLSNGVSIADSYGSPFGRAVELGNTEIVSMLLEAGAGVNLKVPYGDTPLIIATQGDYISIIALLLEKSADPNLCGYYGDSPLHYVTSAEAASLLLQHGAAVNYVMNSNMWSPLHNASQLGHIDVVSSLLAWGADVNAKTRRKETPLHLTRNTRIAELLLEASCDVNAQDTSGNTACHVAVTNHLNCKPSFHHHMAVLLRHGANVNLRNKNDQTLLHLSVLTGVAGIVGGVLAASPDVNAQDNEGNTALHLVVKPFVASLILCSGADVNVRNNKGQTPLHIFVGAGLVDLVVCLLEEASPDVDVKDMGTCPLILESLLVARRPNVNARDNTGKTPLHTVSDTVAKRLGNPQETSRCGIGGSCSVTVMKNGQRQNFTSDLHREREMVSLLMSRGADPDAKDDSGEVCSHLVSSDRCPSAVVAVKGVYKASSSDEDIPLLHFKTSRCGGKVDTRPEGHFRKRKAKHRHSDGLYMRIEELRKEPCLPFEGREANPSVSYLDALKGVGQ